jgi:AbrB family looped-hinge helix DNA binding protein
MAIASKEQNTYTVKLDLQGRIVIPAPVRKAFKLKAGDRVTCMSEGSQLVLRFKRKAGKGAAGV